MTIPVPLKIAAVVLATTAMYTYIGQLVPQKMVLPPEPTEELTGTETPADLAALGAVLVNGKGLCLTCHTMGKSGPGMRFPDLEGIATEDLLGQWSKLIDAWALASTGTDEFRWSQAIDSDLAEFLLHGLERCFHSSAVQAQVTSDEYRVYRPFTLHILQAFVDGLRAEGGTHAEYVEQIKALLGDSLD